MSGRVVGLIPARYASKRFPGKALVELLGKPLIQHVVERCRQAERLAEVIVATDDERIAAAVRGFGGAVRMTAAHHPSGTDRIAEVARELDCDLVVNIQGDEPLIRPSEIDAAVTPLLEDPAILMGTLACPLSLDQATDSNAVKVVVGVDGFALYFSRSPIPYLRDRHAGGESPYLLHVGLYVYRREVLLRLAGLTPTPLEELERLEQLRALEHGIRIRVVRTSQRSLGVDTPADLEYVRGLMEDTRTSHDGKRDARGLSAG
jgi:3-deoxy-manno-octulosonate cytidylyltransferase (CMP-KDO synthetase)